MAFKGDLDSLVLGILQVGDLHGYEIGNRISRLSEEALAVGDGLLYPALRRLETEGFIESYWVAQEGKPDRRTYRITERGTRRLEEKQREWERFSRGVKSILFDPRARGAGGNG